MAHRGVSLRPALKTPTCLWSMLTTNEVKVVPKRMAWATCVFTGTQCVIVEWDSLYLKHLILFHILNVIRGLGSAVIKWNWMGTWVLTKSSCCRLRDTRQEKLTSIHNQAQTDDFSLLPITEALSSSFSQTLQCQKPQMIYLRYSCFSFTIKMATYEHFALFSSVTWQYNL